MTLAERSKPATPYRILAERSQTKKSRTGICQNEAKSPMEAMAGWQNEAKNGLHAATPNAWLF
jgi:hypothetical protein